MLVFVDKSLLNVKSLALTATLLTTYRTRKYNASKCTHHAYFVPQGSDSTSLTL